MIRRVLYKVEDSKAVLHLFLLSRLIFLIFALLAFFLIPLREGYLGKQHFPDEPYLVWIWANFDGRHFADIAVAGYRNFNYAFLPLYPLLIGFFDYHLLIDQPYIGIFISAASLFLAMIMFYKIVKIDYKENIARLSLLLLAFFPLSFFYHSMYADSLFLFLSLASFYFARRGNWILSGIFGALTTLTRLSGLALLPALFLEWVYQNSKSKQLKWGHILSRFLKSKGTICLILTTLGFASYLIYLQIFFGNWLLFQTSFSAWKQDDVVLLPQVLFRYVKILLTVDKNLLVYWIAVSEFFSFFLYMGLAVYVWRKVRASYGVFMIALFLLVTFTGTLAGTPRYALHVFPFFIGIALLLSKKERLVPFVLIGFLVLGLIFTGLFTRGYFIA